MGKLIICIPARTRYKRREPPTTNRRQHQNVLDLRRSLRPIFFELFLGGFAGCPCLLSLTSPTMTLQFHACTFIAKRSSTFTSSFGRLATNILLLLHLTFVSSSLAHLFRRRPAHAYSYSVAFSPPGLYVYMLGSRSFTVHMHGFKLTPDRLLAARYRCLALCAGGAFAFYVYVRIAATFGPKRRSLCAVYLKAN